MAVTFTSIDFENDTYGSPDQTVDGNASFTPTDGSLLVVFVKATCDAHTTAHSWAISDTAGLTWTQREITGTIFDDPNYGAQAVCWTAPVVTGVSMRITVDAFDGSTDQGIYGFRIVEVNGHDAASPIVQSASNIEPTADPLTVTLGATPVAGNVITAWLGDMDDAGSWDAPMTGFVNLGTQDDSADSPSCLRVSTSSTATAITQGHNFATFYGGGGFALEIAPAAASGIDYGTAITDLSPDHHWVFDGIVDSVGTSPLTGTGTNFLGPALAEDASNSGETDGTGDRFTVAASNNMGGAAQAQRAMGGWFQTSAIQLPPVNVYHEGDANNISIVLWAGNQVTFQCRIDAAFPPSRQVFGDRALVVGRSYHLFWRFDDDAGDNSFRAWLDGVELDVAEPSDREVDFTTMPVHSPVEFGSVAGGVGGMMVGDNDLLLVAAVDGRYQHWASWSGANVDALDSPTIRAELFEKGALPDVTISAGTEAAMQTSLDALADTVRPNEPLCIRVEAVTGDGDLTLTADNITFDPLASIHVQYMGSGTLTWVNDNGGDASIGSTPAGGSIVFETPVTAQVTVLDAKDSTAIESARVRLLAAEGPAYAGLVAADGAQSHWRLGESSGVFVDSIGSDDMTVTGDVTRDVTGALFVGDDGAAEFTKGATRGKGAVTLGSTLTGAFTIELWMRHDTNQGSGECAVSSQAGNGSFQIEEDGNGRIRLRVETQTGKVIRGAGLALMGTDWHHVALTVDPVAGMRFYVDGVLNPSEDEPTFTSATISEIRLATNRADTNGWSGLVDEVALYPRALSAAVIARHASYDASTSPLPVGTEVVNTLTNGSGVVSTAFPYLGQNQPVSGRVRKGDALDPYKTASFTGTIRSSGLDLTVLMVPDG